MECYRKAWNKQQVEVRRFLLSFRDHQKAMELFQSQHAMLHSAALTHPEPWSFEDWILDDMTEAHVRRIPHGRSHSVAWIIWHIARIEDVTMNLLLAGTSQVLHSENWLTRMKIEVADVGTGADAAAVADLSTRIDIGALRAYRVTVGRRTREIVKQIQPAELKQKPDAARLQRVIDEGAVAEAALGLVATWGKWKKVRLLAMPATRHSYTHLNEALRLKQRRH